MRRSSVFMLFSAAAVAVASGCGPGGEGEFDLVGRSAFVAGPPAFEGQLVHRIADMLDGTSRESDHLVAPPDEIEVVFADGVQIQRDAIVRVWGDEVDDGVIEVEDYEVVELPPQPLIDAEARPHRRIATVLVFWGSPFIGNDTARDRMFLGDDSTNVFYGENSYGVEKMAGNVFGPYEIPNPGSCNPTAIANSGLDAFLAKGHKEEDYRQFMWVFPSMGDCGFGGLANSGAPDFPAKNSWYNGNFGCVVRNQEIGHNYGMRHSHSYSCYDADDVKVPYSTNCMSTEYGDPYDPMGGGCAHMNMIQKNFMGWIDECNIVTTTSDGTFNINPAELPCNGTQALRIPASTGFHYWLEYRQPYSFDGGLSGVLVHVEEPVGNGAPHPYILAMGQGWYLHEGDPYTDPGGTVTFEVIEETASHAVVQVTFPGGGSGAPTCQGGGEPIMEDGNVGSLECLSEPYPLDTSPPEVTITYPENGAYFPPGSDFTITAEASDDRSVTELELYAGVDGAQAEKLFSSFDAPWEWEVQNIPDGDYEFGVVAWDGPNWTPSNGIVVHVTNDIPNADTGSTGEPTTGPVDSTTGADTGGTDTDDPEMVDTDKGGCGCSASPRPGSAMLGLWLLGLVAVRRRLLRG